MSRLRMVPFALLAVLVAPACVRRPAEPPATILLVTIDTLRRDHVGAYGYPRPTTPFIDGLARDGLCFDRAVTPQPQTAASHSSILSSLHPLSHGVVANGMTLHDRVETIAEALRHAGFRTVGAVSVELMSRRRGFAQGFDEFSDECFRGSPWRGRFALPTRNARAVNRSLFSMIDRHASRRRGQPLFIWAHYYDPHAPYLSHDHIRFAAPVPGAKGIPGYIRRELDKYDQEIRFCDDALRMLVKRLRERGLAKRLLIAVTSDHGEQFGDHGYTFGHPDFYAENTFVPLVFHGHGAPSGKRVATTVSVMDIAVTILGRCRSAFRRPVDGIDLLPRAAAGTALPERKLLIVGTPNFTRSLQLVAFPWAAIANFDAATRFWHPRASSALAEGRFAPVAADALHHQRGDLLVSLPGPWPREPSRVVLRADIAPPHRGLTLQVKVAPWLLTGEESIAAGAERLEAAYPVSVRDQLTFILKASHPAELNHLRWAVVSDREWRSLEPGAGPVSENAVHAGLLTPRKEKEGDELFDLAGDPAMTRNLAERPDLRGMKLRMLETIDASCRYYLKRGRLLRQNREATAELSAEDRRLLRSLGYL